ncbi:kunitz type trypsin inhibitor 104-like [Carya illinoinensis]|nr:kunitz type trypsin inhibitor 104-like [Carya illinoinensis]
MELTRLVGSLSCSIFLVMMAISAAAQPSDDDSSPPVLDTAGRALERGIEYYIKPAITDNGGRFTLIDRNGSCPLYVGQENVSGPDGFPVIFTPFVEGETLIRENRDTKVVFSATTTCLQSTTWKLAERDAESGRRLIVTGEIVVTEENQSWRRAGNFFKIQRTEAGDNIYNIVWCPTEVCNFCRFICGTAGSLVENGKRLLALDGSVLPVVFERA